MSAIRNGEQKLQAWGTSGSAAAASAASTTRLQRRAVSKVPRVRQPGLSKLLHGFPAE
jgi:hypothetical protein